MSSGTTQQERDFMKAVLNTVSALVVVLDLDGRITRFNQACETMAGYREDEVLGRCFWEFLIPPEDLPGVLATWRQLRAGDFPNRHENRWMAKDGSERLIAWSNTAIVRPTGEMQYIIGTGQDITERKRAEAEFRESQRKYQTLIETTGDFIWEMDSHGRYTYCSPQMEKLWGIKPDEVIGKTPFDAMPAEHKNRAAESFTELAKSPQPFNGLESTAYDGHGRLIYIEASGVPFFDDAGNLLGFRGISRDITERKRAEQERELLISAIQKEKERLVALVNSIQDEVWFADTEKKFTLANPRALREFGLNGETDVDVREFAQSLEVYRPDGTPRPVEEAPALRALRGELITNLEEIIVTPRTGEQRVRQVSATPVKDAEGCIIGSVSVVRDTTQLKQAEESLRRNEARSRLLADTAGRLLATEKPQAMVEELCHAVMAYLDCQTFFNFLIDEEAGRLHLNACSGIPEAEARKIEWLDYGVAVCGCVARDRARIIADDIFHIPDPRTDLIKSFGIQAYCCHPLMAHGHLIGTLSFGTKTRPHFSPEEVETMRIVTDQVAIAMDRIRLLDTIRRSRDDLEIRVRERTADLANLSSQLVSAQENERRRISYDLHDNVWQTLVAIRFEIERLFSKLGKEDETVLHKRSKEVMADMLSAVGKIRSMQGDLWPYVLDDIGLTATIDWYCREFEKSHSGLTIARKNDLAESEIPLPAKIVIYRIIQETLSNVAKHSQASHVTLRLTKNDHEVELVVEDNGIGFNPEETFASKNPWGGFGLSTIKARTELSGGVFGVESSKGKGTTIRASWPI